MDAPVIPVQGEAVYCYDVHRVEHTVRAHQLDEVGVDGRNAAQHQRQSGLLTAYRVAGRNYHLREPRPVGIEFEIPMGEVIGLIP